MQQYWQALWLALLQGLTEFLPISSSGHLVLLPKLLGWRDQGLAFDVAVHMGTLFAVLAYFQAEVRQMLGDWGRSIVGYQPTASSTLAWHIFFATSIVGLAGLLFGDWISQNLRAPLVVANAILGFGILLGLADWWGSKQRSITELNWRDVLVIGGAQALALLPGTSRAGITITAALALGLTRVAAAHFSFLLAIPVLLLAGGWQVHGLLTKNVAIQWDILIFATAISAAVAFLCIHWFIAFLQRHSLLWFALYRIVLGAVLLLVFT